MCYCRIRSSCGEDLGRARVFRADVPQVEESTTVSAEGHLIKRVRVTVTCDITFNSEEDHTLIVTGKLSTGIRLTYYSIFYLCEVIQILIKYGVYYYYHYHYQIVWIQCWFEFVYIAGTAVVERRGRVAKVLRLEEVALGSQISVLFRHSSKTLLFIRE